METAPSQTHKARIRGEVRVRSNVCFKSNEWHLVPGDLLKSCDLPLRYLTTKQREELMYYERCCLCQRTVCVFMQEGCDYCASRGHGSRQLPMHDVGEKSDLRAIIKHNLPACEGGSCGRW